MKWMLVFLLAVAVGSVAMEADPRPIVTEVAVKAVFVKTEARKTAVSKFTRTMTPTNGPSSTITQTPNPASLSATPTPTRTPAK
jgi:hypothetical protein